METNLGHLAANAPETRLELILEKVHELAREGEKATHEEHVLENVDAREGVRVLAEGGEIALRLLCLRHMPLHQVLQCVAVCCGELQCVAVCCSVLQCVAVYCSVLQCVAVCCSVL